MTLCLNKMNILGLGNKLVLVSFLMLSLQVLITSFLMFKRDINMPVPFNRWETEKGFSIVSIVLMISGLKVYFFKKEKKK